MNILRSIRTKLFALVFFASCALVSAIYWQIGSVAKHVANDVIERSLEQAGRVLDTRIQSRYIYIEEIANGLANDGRLRPLIYERQSLTLQDLSVEYQRVYEFSSLFFLDAKGSILARSDQPKAIGINLAGKSSLFDNALAGNVSRGFFVSQGKLMQGVVVPVFDNVSRDLIQGAVVIAYEFSPAMAQEILALTQSDVGFYVFTRQQGDNSNRAPLEISGTESTFITSQTLGTVLSQRFDDEPSLWRPLITSSDAVLRKDLIINNTLYHARLSRIDTKDGNPLGFVLNFRSDVELRQPFTKIRRAIVIDGSITLIIASLFALIMAISISKPIVHLVSMVKKIQEGEYTEAMIPSSKKDEVGILRNAIINMGQSLKEKAELEAYLADLADEVVDDDTLAVQGIQKIDLAGAIDQTIIQSSDAMHLDDNTTTDTALIAQRFKLLNELGSGAMGTVYLAQDLALNEKTAIKIIEKSVFEHVEGFNFKEEIRLARKITHRNIVRTFDFGDWQNKIYISMEYVPGYDLGKLMAKKGALDLQIGLALCKQICFAMISAHQLGIIHRDLKPANMIINRQGILKIMDFGLATQLQTELSIQHQHGEGSIQTNGYMMGTPRFMAPEQFSINAEVDARTDIYSIGVIMFTIFNGRPPFKGKNLSDIAKLHQQAPIPDISHDKNIIPPILCQIISKALAKKPDDRFQTVKTLLEHLNTV